MPAFTHVLALQDGRVLASGRKEAVLRSAVLSSVFRARIRLRRRGGGYTLQVAPKRGGVV